MFKKNISICILASCIMAVACNNEDKQKPADIPKDSVAVDKTGKAAVDSTKTTETNSTSAPAKKNENIKDIPKKATDAVKDATEKVKNSANAVADAGKKAIRKVDSTVTAKKTEAATAKKENSPSTDSKLLPASTADNSKSFAPKYGLIPWNSNENNITAFKNAFPDKQTLVRVNFDADADAQMQTTKTQIINALKKAGYKNVSDQSQTFHPTRIPKDIHYELQHDGSVTIWLPPNSQQ